MAKSPNTFQEEDWTYDNFLDPNQWNKSTRGTDRQIYNIGTYIGGAGVIAGGVITGAVGAAKGSVYVTAVTALVGGFIGAVASDYHPGDDLVDNKVNYLWCQRVDAPAPARDPTYSDTYSAEALNIVVQDIQPANSCLLGTVTLDAAGLVTAVNSSPTDRQTVYPVAVKELIVDVVVTGLAEGSARWVDVDHSATIQFELLGLLQYDNPMPDDILGGFEISRLENAQPGGFGFYIENVGSGGETYYGETEVTIRFRRRGVPV